MPGFRLMLQDNKGEYPHSGHALIFEGSMLVYDHQRDIAQWVPIRGTSATLTMPELRTVYDLSNMVPLPSSELPVVKPPSEILKCIPVGAESNTNSSVIDLGDEWDKTETVGPSRSSTPTIKIGPTWEEVHAATQEEEMAKNQAPSWEDIVNGEPNEEEENWDKEDSQSPATHQFDDVIIEEVTESVTEEDSEPSAAREPLTKLTEVAGGSESQEDLSTCAGDHLAA